MAECKLTAEFTRGLRECNAMIYVAAANRFAPPGWPDRLIVHSLWAGLIEFKDTDTVVQPHQRIILRDINLRRPYFAFVVRFPNVIECFTTYTHWEFDGTPLGLLKELNRQQFGLENAGDFLTAEQQRLAMLAGVDEIMRAAKRSAPLA